MKIVQTTEKIQQARLAQRVKDLRATSLGTHNADTAQHGEMVRHRGNVQLHQGRQIGYAMLAFRESTDDPHSRRMAQCLEDFRHSQKVLAILR